VPLQSFLQYFLFQKVSLGGQKCKCSQFQSSAITDTNLISIKTKFVKASEMNTFHEAM
jgi:hypothetical protein